MSRTNDEHVPLWKHAETVIGRTSQKQLPVDDLVERVSKQAGRDVDSATMVGVIAQKVRQGETFRRVKPGVYALKVRSANKKKAA